MKGCVSHLIIYLPFCLKLDRHNPTDKVKQMNTSDINAKMVQCDASKLVIHNQQSCQYTRLWSIYRVRLLIIKLLLTSFLLNFEHPWNLYIPQKVLYSVKRVFRLIMFFKGIVYLKNVIVTYLHTHGNTSCFKPVTFFCWTKEDTVKNVGNKHLFFHTMKVNGYRQLFVNQHFSKYHHRCSTEERNATGLEYHEDE